MTQDVAWLEKLANASREALQRLRESDDPFSRLVADDLERFVEDTTRRLAEARSELARHRRLEGLHDPGSD